MATPHDLLLKCHYMSRCLFCGKLKAILESVRDSHTNKVLWFCKVLVGVRHPGFWTALFAVSRAAEPGRNQVPGGDTARSGQSITAYPVDIRYAGGAEHTLISYCDPLVHLNVSETPNIECRCLKQTNRKLLQKNTSRLRTPNI